MTHFTLPAGHLHTAAEWAARATPTRGSLPILHALLLDAADDQTTISGFDYDRRATVTVDALVHTPGRLLVPAAFLVAVAKAAGAKTDITLDDSGGVKLTAGRAHWTGPNLPLEDYPALPDLGEPIGEVDATDFFHTVTQVIPAASNDDTLPVLTAVQITSDGNTLTVAATDRYRLAAATIPWKPTRDQPVNVLVPKDALAVAARSGATGTLTLTTSDNDSLFGISTTGRVTTTRQMDLEYPRWRSLLPTPGELWARFSTADMRQAIGQITPAVDRVFHLDLTIADDTITMFVAGDERSAETTIPATTQGELQIKFNGEWLRQALDTTDSDQVTCYFTTPTRPVLIHGDQPDRYQHLLMPVRGAS